MSEEVTESTEEQVERLVRARYPEGVIRQLERRFPAAAAADCEDAVSTGFEKLLCREGPLQSPEGYVTTVAQNVMKRLMRRAAFEQLADEDDDGEQNEVIDRGLDPWSDPVSEGPIAKDAYEFVLEVVSTWESRNYKAAMELGLEAAWMGEPLSSEELSEKLHDVLGEDVKPATARQWRKRATDRLRRQLIEADLIEEEAS